MTWRLSSKHGSAGDLGDIGCHIYDMTTLLCGDIAEINCQLRTFDKGVPGNQLGEYVLDANDSFVSIVSFANGGLGTIHSSRWATGQANSLRVRVYGDEGAHRGRSRPCLRRIPHLPRQRCAAPSPGRR